MKYWQAESGDAFTNSDNCKVVSYAIDEADIDVVSVTITGGRYPENGYVYNDEAHEMAYVVSGVGACKIKGREWQALSPGDVIYFAPKDRLAWQTDKELKLVISCGPAFDSAKYHSEKEIK